MRVFVAIGFAIIITLTLITLWSERCLTCCDGQPCNPDLYVNRANMFTPGVDE